MASTTRLAESDHYELECLIDNEGLSNVLDAIACICFDKAHHVRSEWGLDDERLARRWEEMGGRLDTAAGAATKKGLD